MKILNILAAPAGSGKSTLSKSLVGTICSADHYFLDKDGNYNFDVNRLRIAHEICEANAFAEMAKGNDVIVDNTNTDFKSIFVYLRGANVFGFKVIFHIFKIDKSKLDLLVSRNVHGVPRHTIERQIDRLLHMRKTLVANLAKDFPNLQYEVIEYD